MRLNSDKKGRICGGELAEGFEGFFEIWQGIGDGAVGEVEIIAEWGSFKGGEKRKIVVLLKKSGFFQVFLEFLPFFGLKQR